MTKTKQANYKKELKKSKAGEGIAILYLDGKFNIIKRYTADYDVMNTSDPQSSTVRCKNRLDAVNSIIDWDLRLSK